jgi:hypothetical protein
MKHLLVCSAHVPLLFPYFIPTGHKYRYYFLRGQKRQKSFGAMNLLACVMFPSLQHLKASLFQPSWAWLSITVKWPQRPSERSPRHSHYQVCICSPKP